MCSHHQTCAGKYLFQQTQQGLEFVQRSARNQNDGARMLAQRLPEQDNQPKIFDGPERARNISNLCRCHVVMSTAVAIHVPVTRHGISSPDDLHVSQFGWSAVSPSRPAISLSAGHRGGQGKRAAARSHAQPHLCGEHGEHRRALDLEGRGDQRNASSGWVHRNFRFRFPQSLRHVGKRKREAIKKRALFPIRKRDPAHKP